MLIVYSSRATWRYLRIFRGIANYTNVQIIQIIIGSDLGQIGSNGKNQGWFLVLKAKAWPPSSFIRVRFVQNFCKDFYFRWIFPVLIHGMSGISSYWEWVCSQILNNWSKSSTRRGFLKEENEALLIRSQLQPNHITIVDSQRIIFRTYAVTVVFFNITEIQEKSDRF